MRAIELRKMTKDELDNELFSSLKELFNLRMQKGSGQLTKPHLLRIVRRRIARLRTLIAEKRRV
jgi:large subunit ribosomal protein L29